MTITEKDLHIFERCVALWLDTRRSKWTGHKKWEGNRRVIALATDGPKPIGVAFVDRNRIGTFMDLVLQRGLAADLPHGCHPCQTGPKTMTMIGHTGFVLRWGR